MVVLAKSTSGNEVQLIPGTPLGSDSCTTEAEAVLIKSLSLDSDGFTTANTA